MSAEQPQLPAHTNGNGRHASDPPVEVALQTFVLPHHEAKPGLTDRKLTRRQWRFVAWYLRCGNASQAVLKCRFTKDYASATVIGCKLMADSRVRAEIDLRLARLMYDAGVTKEGVLRELARVAFVDPLELFEPNDHGRLRLRELDRVPEGARRAISSVKVQRVLGDDPIEVIEVKFWPKTAALAELRKEFDKKAAAGTADDPIVHQHNHQVLFYIPENGR